MPALGEVLQGELPKLMPAVEWTGLCGCRPGGPGPEPQRRSSISPGRQCRRENTESNRTELREKGLSVKSGSLGWELVIATLVPIAVLCKSSIVPMLKVEHKLLRVPLLPVIYLVMGRCCVTLACGVRWDC